MLTNVRLRRHLTIRRVYIKVENARTALNELGAIGAPTSLATVCKVDAGVGTPEVAAMIATS